MGFFGDANYLGAKMREFWIDESHDPDSPLPMIAWDSIVDADDKPPIHVVEFSAYETLKAENQKLLQANKILDECLGMIEHIGLHEPYDRIAREAREQAGRVK